MAVTGVQEPRHFLRWHEGDYVLHDPWHSELWQVGAPLGVLSEDPITRDGVVYLQTREQPLTVNLIGTQHVTEDQWNEVVKQRSGRLLGGCVLWMEADWEPEAGNPNSIRVLPKLKHEGLGAFFLAGERWAGEQQPPLPVAPFDIDGPDEPLRQSLKQLFYQAKAARFDLDPCIDQDRERFREFLAHTIYYAIRVEMLAAMIGNIVAVLDAQGMTSSEVSIVMGWRNLKRLEPVLKRYGVDVTFDPLEQASEDVLPDSKGEELQALRGEMIATRRLSAEKVRRMSELSAD
jgi:hypothetical protein